MTNSNNNYQPVYILPEGTQRNTGRAAQRNNILAAKLVAETVRTTLGPKGMDKMIVDSSGDVVITNDGVTILDEMKIEHPAAKMIVEIAKTQEDEVGDGTTTAVVIAGELLKNAENLIDQNIHPTLIVRGYQIAAERAIKILHEIAIPIENEKETLLKISKTAMTGKGAEIAKDHLSELLTSAVLQIADNDSKIPMNNIKIEKRVGESVESSELIKGILLDKERVHSGMPETVMSAKILLLDCALEIKDTEVDAKIQINDPTQMQAFLDQEEKMIKNMVEKVANSGANVVFCQKGIDDLAQHFLAKKGIFAARRVKQSDMQKLALATGAKVLTTLEDVSDSDLGGAGKVYESKINDEEMIYITECPNPKAVTLLVRGGTEHVVEEVKRAVDDALGDVIAAYKDKKIVAGAGATEVEVAKELRKFAETLSGREQLAVQAFADSLEVIPKTLAENAGMDPIDVITELKALHDRKDVWAGINVFTGKSMDAMEQGVVEPLRIKTQAIKAAAEVATMILRIDDVILGGGSDMPQPPMGGMPGMM